jgi:hypothetical protein
MIHWDSTLPVRGRQALERASYQERQAAFKRALEYMDTLPFKGRRVTSSQNRAWPRIGVFREDGTWIAGVPGEFKKATGMVAGFILASIPFSAPALAWVILEIGHLLEEGADIIGRDVAWN